MLGVCVCVDSVCWLCAYLLIVFVGCVYELGQGVLSQLCMLWLYALVVWVCVLLSLLVLSRDVRKTAGCFGSLSFFLPMIAR